MNHIIYPSVDEYLGPSQFGDSVNKVAVNIL